MKKNLTCFLLFVCLLLLTGCGSNQQGKKYKSYVESLITANYLGISDEYLEATGANESDAEALYLGNATRLAENLISYYGLEISNDSDLGPAMVELAKNIYSKTSFSTNDAYKQGDDYYVDVTIYPIDIINQTNDAVTTYIEDFNQRVLDGDYNDYERDEYENEFATGLIQLLQDAVSEISYTDPVVITVKIITSEDSFYISDEDVLAIDAAVIAGEYDTDYATPGDAE